MKNIKKNFQQSIQNNKSMFQKQLNNYEFITDLKNKINNVNFKKNFYKLNPVPYFESLQDQLESFANKDQNFVVLKQSKFWISSINWILSGGTLFGIGWISIAKTEEIVIATGKLIPESGVIEVQMPLQGITEEVLVKEGDKVVKGQVLIRLDDEIITSKNDALQQSLKLNNTINEKLRTLVKEGAVSELQYLQHQQKIVDIKSEIQANLVRKKYQEILSPADGFVFNLLPKGAGFVANTSQPVLKIVPSDNLKAEVEIASRTIGFVKEGRPVEISIDSFPASDYGVIKGTVKRIGSDALPPSPSEGKGYRFPTIIVLENQFLKVKSGKKLKLQAGMSLSANIKLRKVTYLQLLLNKFSDKTDSLKSI